MEQDGNDPGKWVRVDSQTGVNVFGTSTISPPSGDYLVNWSAGAFGLRDANVVCYVSDSPAGGNTGTAPHIMKDTSTVLTDEKASLGGTGYLSTDGTRDIALKCLQEDTKTPLGITEMTTAYLMLTPIAGVDLTYSSTTTTTVP